eukprot:TRINITY_DN69939_c0_g1_i1.p1 TRINITY_DN69939_c0_g1~~TRINITY_DN69939_c0_g1_i1.p1  ORF type:complete len:2563 (+),score=583.10 TRINITY_DN69939_c0_g1_i1:84-7691(+)
MGNTLTSRGGAAEARRTIHAHGGDAALARVEQTFGQLASGRQTPTISIAQFRRHFLEGVLPHFPDPVADAICRACEVQCDAADRVCLDAIVRGLATVRYGTPAERLDLLFSIYDVAQKERVSMDELQHFMVAAEGSTGQEPLPDTGEWRCANCTFVNGPFYTSCNMCQTQPHWLSKHDFIVWAQQNLTQGVIVWVNEFGEALKRMEDLEAPAVERAGHSEGAAAAAEEKLPMEPSPMQLLRKAASDIADADVVDAEKAADSLYFIHTELRQQLMRLSGGQKRLLLLLAAACSIRSPAHLLSAAWSFFGNGLGEALDREQLTTLLRGLAIVAQVAGAQGEAADPRGTLEQTALEAAHRLTEHGNCIHDKVRDWGENTADGREFLSWVCRLGVKAVLADKPQDPSEERRYITSLSCGLALEEPGTEVYLLPRSWWKCWCDATASGAVTSMTVPRIDCNELLDSGGDLSRLALLGRDFIYVTPAAWDALSAWYGCEGDPLKRSVVVINGASRVELWPPRVRVVRGSPEKPLGCVAGREPHTLTLSCVTTHRELRRLACRALDLDPAACTVWDTDPQEPPAEGGWRPLVDSAFTIGESEFADRHLFVVSQAEAVAPRARPVPEQLFIPASDGDQQRQCAGHYYLQPLELMNGFPTWRQRPGSGLIYADHRGFWRVAHYSDATEQQPVYGGAEYWWRSKARHMGKFPDECRDWMAYFRGQKAPRPGEGNFRVRAVNAEGTVSPGILSPRSLSPVAAHGPTAAWGRASSSGTGEPPRPAFLVNFGNTCFMDSCLQVLFATQHLREYFCEGLHLRDVASAAAGQKGTGGVLAVQVGRTLQRARKEAKFKVRQFHSVLDKFDATRTFTDLRQHDASDFWCVLTDHLEAELCYPEPEDSPKSSSSPARKKRHSDREAQAAAHWERHMKATRSPLTGLTCVQRYLEKKCEGCQRYTLDFLAERWTLVDMPEGNLYVTVRLLLGGKPSVMARVRLPPTGTAGDLLDQLAALPGIDLTTKDMVLVDSPPWSKWLGSPVAPDRAMTTMGDTVTVHAAEGLAAAATCLGPGFHVVFAEHLEYWRSNVQCSTCDTTAQGRKAIVCQDMDAMTCEGEPVGSSVEKGDYVVVVDILHVGGDDPTTAPGAVCIHPLEDPKDPRSEPREDTKWLVPWKIHGRCTLHCPDGDISRAEHDLVSWSVMNYLVQAQEAETRAEWARAAGHYADAVPHLMRMDQLIRGEGALERFAVERQQQLELLASAAGAAAVRLVHRRGGQLPFRAAPPLFGQPGVVVLRSGLTSREVHQEVWHRIRFLAPDHPQREWDVSGASPPFSLRQVSPDGRSCSRCKWFTGCPGCVVPWTEAPDPVFFSPWQTLAVVWQDEQVVREDIAASWEEHPSVASNREDHDREHRLETCLRRTFHTLEQVTGRCQGCGEEEASGRHRAGICRVPPVLVLVLRRTNPATGSKLDTMVSFPVEGLDMAPLVEPCQESPPPECSDPLARAAVRCPQDLYDLYAVVRHQGATVNSGHYLVNVRHQGRWWECCDLSGVTPIDASAVCSKDAFMLFYQRRDVRDRRVTELFPRPPNDPAPVEEFEIMGADCSWRGDRGVLRCTSFEYSRANAREKQQGARFCEKVKVDVIDITDEVEFDPLAPADTHEEERALGDTLLEKGATVYAAKDLVGWSGMHNRPNTIQAGDSGLLRERYEMPDSTEVTICWDHSVNCTPYYSLRDPTGRYNFRAEKRKFMMTKAGKPLRLQDVRLGHGQVPHGLEQALEAAEQGEVMRVRVAGCYDTLVTAVDGGSPTDLGDAERPHRWFWVRVHQTWNSEDISQGHDGTLLKRVIQRSDSGLQPCAGDKVILLIAWEYDGRRVPPDAPWERRTVCVGDGTLPAAAERALMSMRQGEVAQVKAVSRLATVDAEVESPSAAGQTKRTADPAGTFVRITLVLEAVTQTSQPGMLSPEERAAETARLLDEGDRWMRSAQWARAQDVYARAAEFARVAERDPGSRAREDLLRATMGRARSTHKQGLLHASVTHASETKRIMGEGTTPSSIAGVERAEVEELFRASLQGVHEQRDYIPKKGMRIKTRPPEKNATYPCLVTEVQTEGADAGVLLDFTVGGTRVCDLGTMLIPFDQWADKKWQLCSEYTLKAENGAHGMKLQGTNVAELDPERAAAKAGLQVGMTIIEVEQKPVSTEAEVVAALAAAAPAADLTLRIAPVGRPWPCAVCGTQNPPAGQCAHCSQFRSVVVNGICPQGHPMVETQVNPRKAHCIICQRQVHTLFTVYQCGRCDFIKCSRCAGVRPPRTFTGEFNELMMVVARKDIRDNQGHLLAKRGDQLVVEHTSQRQEVSGKVTKTLHLERLGPQQGSLRLFWDHDLYLEPSIEWTNESPGEALVGSWEVPKVASLKIFHYQECGLCVYWGNMGPFPLYKAPEHVLTYRSTQTNRNQAMLPDFVAHTGTRPAQHVIYLKRLSRSMMLIVQSMCGPQECVAVFTPDPPPGQALADPGQRDSEQGSRSEEENEEEVCDTGDDSRSSDIDKDRGTDEASMTDQQ